jgi:hypothetical protein
MVKLNDMANTCGDFGAGLADESAESIVALMERTLARRERRDDERISWVSIHTDFHPFCSIQRQNKPRAALLVFQGRMCMCPL